MLRTLYNLSVQAANDRSKKKGVTSLCCQYSQATYQHYVVITKQIHDAMQRKATYHF